jgi:hypothetical protein
MKTLSYGLTMPLVFGKPTVIIENCYTKENKTMSKNDTLEHKEKEEIKLKIFCLDSQKEQL